MTKKTEAPPAAREKRKPNSGSFSKERPSPNAFEPGQSGNPGGKPREYRALARALRADGAGRAEDALCDHLGLPRGSSRIQAQSRRIWRLMNYGEPSIALEASKFYAQLNGENAPSKLALGLDPDAMGEEAGEFAPGPRLQVVFVSSESDLARDIAAGRIIDRPSPQRDPDPAAEAAPREAEAQVIAPDAPEPKALPSPAPPSPDRESPWPASLPDSPQKVRERVYRKLGY